VTVYVLTSLGTRAGDAVGETVSMAGVN
jgi:hypothetical protein